MNKLTRLCLLLIVLFAFIFIACEGSGSVMSLKEETLFTLGYGSFEDELNMFSLANPGPVKTSVEMRDGFFYLANGESKKLMEFNSYGDLISIIYNEDSNPRPSFASETQDTTESVAATRKAVSYPFNSIGPIAIDSKKYMYVVDKLPVERQEQDTKNRTLLSQVVLRFDSNGNFIDYIGQQGPGGVPFPHIREIFITKQNELVVVCQTNDGMTAYWFNNNGYLLYTVPFAVSKLPNPLKDQTELEMFVSLEKIIPSRTEKKLFVKVDYYTTSVDSASNVQSGIDYTTTLLYPLDVETGVYEAPLTIPAYEESMSDGFSRIVYPLSYDFVGITDSGWLYFMIADTTGYTVQMIQENGQKILIRHLDIKHEDNLFYDFSISSEGIISALSVKEDGAVISWWRTDLLIAAILQG
ncbi:MAG: hypothetical protein IKZ04_02540 [Spirochaetaceae bacterium]|nr:hypothetical protein [Spirochaetaceae bacterium]